MLINKKNKKTILIIAVLVIACLAIKYFTVAVSFFVQIIDACFALILGCAIAYILNIVMKKYESIYFPNSDRKIIKKSKRAVCILLSILTVLAIIIGIVIIVIPELYKCFELLSDAVPRSVDVIKSWVNKNITVDFIRNKVNSIDFSWKHLEPAMIGYFKVNSSEILSSVISVTSSIAGTIADIVIAVIFSVYILFNKEKLSKQFKKLIEAYGKKERTKKLLSYLKIADKTFSSFITGQCIEAVILGFLCFAGMVILRFPYAGVTAAVVGLTALIPIVGAFIGAFIGAFLIFTVSPIKAVMFIIFLIILQQCEQGFIYPKVVGKSVGLPGMWVLAGITVGGGLFGIAGMLIGVPITATVYKILQQSVNTRIKEKKIVKALETNKDLGDTIIIKKQDTGKEKQDIRD